MDVYECQETILISWNAKARQEWSEQYLTMYVIEKKQVKCYIIFFS